jgi:hypothetical protein
MSLIIASSENVFEGAAVFNGEKKKFVYKVNKKTMYVGDLTYEVMNSKYEARMKGVTWKVFMQMIKAEMVDFGVWKISSEEAAKKEKFDAVNSIKKHQLSPMSKKAEQQVEVLYKVYLKSLTGIKGKTNYRFPNEIGSERIIALAFTEDRWSILSINGTIFFYDLDYKIYILFNKKEHKLGKDIIWPVREYEKASSSVA